MAPTFTPLSPVSLPSQAQIALAIVILRSKPVHTSVREFILGLRAQIKNGCNPIDTLQQNEYIQLVSYWHDQYLSTQKECDRLRRLNVKLERSNHQLSVSCGATLNQSDLQTPSSKRKAASASTGNRAKKPRLAIQSTTTQTGVSETQGVIENDAEFLDGLGEEGSNLSEHLFVTHSLCRASDCDADALCYSLTQTSSALAKVIRKLSQSYEHLAHQESKSSRAASLDKDKSLFASALTICARAFMSALVGAQKLLEMSSDGRLSGLIVCELAEMFKSALSSIQLAARQTATKVASQPKANKKNKDEQLLETIKESIPARAIAHLLIGFLGFLEKTNSFHQKVFEGFTFVLFERIGKQLYYCTFGNHRSTTTEGNIIPGSKPECAFGPSSGNTDVVALRLELKALVLILERAMGLAPNHMNSQSTPSSKTSGPLSRTLSFKTLPAASRSRLSSLAKDRLQRTLLTCMYGEKAQDDFLDVLTKPMSLIRLSNLKGSAKIVEEDVELWYKREVWRLVGWDILAREDVW